MIEGTALHELPEEAFNFNESKKIMAHVDHIIDEVMPLSNLTGEEILYIIENCTTHEFQHVRELHDDFPKLRERAPLILGDDPSLQMAMIQSLKEHNVPCLEILKARDEELEQGALKEAMDIGIEVLGGANMKLAKQLVVLAGGFCQQVKVVDDFSHRETLSLLIREQKEIKLSNLLIEPKRFISWQERQQLAPVNKFHSQKPRNQQGRGVKGVKR